MAASNQQYSTNTGLSAQPELSGLAPDITAEFTRLYNAIRILQSAIDSNAGTTSVETQFYGELSSLDTIKLQNISKFYPVLTGAVSAGNLLWLSNSGSTVTASLACADDGGAPHRHYAARAFALESGAAGARCACALTGMNNNFSGLIPGFIYYLAGSVYGTISLFPPPVFLPSGGGNGTVSQLVGFAITDTALWFNPELVV